MLISPEYLDLQRQMHAAPRGYGRKGDKWAAVVEEIARTIKANTILDYGCGQGSLGRVLRASGWNVAEYDPAIAGKNASPDPAGLVVCTDVLEHIEEACIDTVLDHLRRVTLGCLFAVISTVPAQKLLPDGRNAHVLQRPPEWWHEKLSARFTFSALVDCRAHKEFAAIWSAV